MIQLHLLILEWKHFTKNPFKILAFLLFIVAGIYGMHNGAALYHKQITEINKLRKKAEEQEQKIINFYNKGEKGPADRPWIDVTTPFWAIWNLPTYAFKVPSASMVYCIGQTEQYGFYKQISVWASAQDADLTNEIANPERLQSGNLDFSFVLLYLSPVLLLLVCYNIKTTENEQGFLQLIQLQVININTWLANRLLFYFLVTLLSIIILLLYGAILTPVFTEASNVFGWFLLYSVVYIFLWITGFYYILKYSKAVVGAALKMIASWLIICFLIPAAVHQTISIAKPANLMLDFIDVQRDGREKIFNQPDSVIDKQLIQIFPNLRKTKLFTDTAQRIMLRNYSGSALAYNLVNKTLVETEKENNQKNKLVKQLYWLNPISFFQNQLNKTTQTHYDNYKKYRDDIDRLIQKRIEVMVMDIWDGKTITKTDFLTYKEQLSFLP